jgi:hypothetical protein
VKLKQPLNGFAIRAFDMMLANPAKIIVSFQNASGIETVGLAENVPIRDSYTAGTIDSCPELNNDLTAAC